MSSGRTITIARRGESPRYTVVISRNASEAIRYAASELCEHIEKQTGVKLPVADDSTPRPPLAVMVGASDHAPVLEGKAPGLDGFRIYIRDGNIAISSPKDRGVLYGVYELLERFGGCRWYSSWCSKTPELEEFSVPEDLDVTETPALEMREPYWWDVTKNAEFAARLRVNSLSWRDTPAKLGGNEFRFGGGLGSCHTFNKILPPDKFFDSHPEYFSFEDGIRKKHPTQLCLTNPDVLRIVTERVLEAIRKDPGAKFYGISQNDWAHYCQCPACAAVDAEEESHAGTLVRFINAVAEAVEKEFPDVLIETLAYQYTRKPPKLTKLRHNVVPCLCTIECDFGLPIDESLYHENISFRSDIQKWSQQTKWLYIWDYTTNYSRFPWEFANAYTLQGNIKFFIKNGARFLFEQGDHKGSHAGFAELKAWLMTKWMWNPDLPADKLLDDFFAGYYGKGAPFIREYFEELHRYQREWSRGGANRRHGIYDGPDNPAIPDTFYPKSRELWAKAAEAVRDDPVTSFNVRMGEFSVIFSRFDLLYHKINRPVILYIPEDFRAAIPELRQLAKSVLATMEEAGDIRLVEAPISNKQINDAIRRLASDETPDPGISNIAKAGRIYIRYQDKTGEYATDPVTGNEAIKIFGSNSDICAELPFNWILYAPGSRYHIRLRLRVDSAADKGEAFRAGKGNYFGEMPIDELITVQVEDASEEYRWYDLGDFNLNEEEFIWVSAGRPGPDGKSAVKAVWLECMEFTPVEK